MLVKFNLSTQSYRAGSVVDLPHDESLQSLLDRGIVEAVVLETKPAVALETKPKRARK
jgi:hypothetical protein